MDAADATGTAIASDNEEPRTIVHWFEKQAAKTPLAPSVQCEKTSLTYRELDARATRLASVFHAHGVRPGEHVAVLLERSIDLLPALLAILKCGGAYVPLEPTLPEPRRRMILEEVQPVLVVTQRRLASLISGNPLACLCLDEIARADATEDFSAQPSPQDAAYVIYTSGSTGRPKGVVVRHDSVANLLRSMRESTLFGETEVVVAATSITFDISVLELFLPLVCGGQVVLASDAQRIDPKALVKLIGNSSATFFQATPTMWRMLIEAGWGGSPRLFALSGGEALPNDLAEALLPRCRALWNGYGPTETTIYSLGCRILDGKEITIGTPLDNTRIYIVDGKGRLCAPGEKGELWIGGIGVAVGYLRQPELSAERFIPDPFSALPDERVFRTGDLVSLGVGEKVAFHGRLDDQVKIRGHRVELAEIEATLSRNCDVACCAVTTRQGQSGLELVAYVVPRVNEELSSTLLRQWLGRHLPDYMVPERLFVLEALPLTPGGKIDRKMLSQVECREAPAGGALELPRDDLERELCGIWQAVLDRSHIGIHDNFFELGGHSLRAAQLAHQVEKFIGRRFPIAHVFQAQTIAELSAMIKAEDWAPAWSSLVPLRVEGDKAPLFFVHGYGGDVYAFVDLVRCMQRGRPVYGLQAVELSGRNPPHETIEQMATHYAQEIRSLQPEGPYHLAGYSLGGWIAYAVAQDLKQLGHEVAFLGLFDTFPTAKVPWRYYLLAIIPDLADRAAKHLHVLRSIPWSAKWSYLTGPLRSLRFILTRGRGKAGAKYLEHKGWETDLYDAAHARYRPPPYHGPVELFVASEGKHFSYSFWRRLVRGRTRFHTVTGSHDDVLSAANCPALARKLEAALQSCYRDEVSGTRRGEDATVHRLFEEQAKKTPDAVALESGEVCLTYRELDVRSNQLAAALAVAGVEPDEVVGIYAPMSAATLVGVLAILKAGAAYLPVDMALPCARRAFILQDSRCKIVLARTEHTSQLLDDLRACGLSTRLVALDGTDRAIAGPVESAAASSARPENLAYVLYTSGSTGRPKGVEMPHHALVNLLRWQESISSEGKSGRTLQFASLGFDVSFQEIFATWLSGGTLVLVDGVVRRDWEKLLQFIDQRKINRLFLPFVVLENIAAAAARCGIVPASVKEVFVAGEQLRIGSDIRRLFSRLRGARLWNHYGPTETHVVTGFMLDGDPEEWPDLPPIGKPVPSCEIRLLDETMRPVPAGVPAELYISGLPLARGYRNSPELTAERFLPSWKSPHEKMYKTGDVARLNPDGTFEFVGRSDFQVKIRGHRIELGEIEAILGKYPHIANCAVMVEEGPVGKQLVAFVVPRDRAVLSLASLRGVLSAELPDYMIPTRFVLLPALPLTPNGKVDREALGQAKGSEVSTGAEQTAPRHELEHRLAEIWKSLLSRRHVGVHDNFFELGGNSLLVAFCCAEIERQVGIRVPLGTFFEHSTIAGLSEKLRSLPTGIVVMPVAGHNTAPLACFAQESMWFLQQYLPDAATYNQPLAWHFSGFVDEEKLRVSLEEIMSRHEILRTALVYEEGYLVQRISRMEHSKVPWRQVLCESQAAADDCLCAEARRPFALAISPLWRCLWIEISRDDHILLLVFHHSIIDEWSMRLLVAELETIYAGKAPDELRLQFSDYAAWERRGLAGTRLDIGSAYWRRQLVDIPLPLKWPSVSGQPKRPTGGGLTQSFRLDASVVAKLRPLAREEGTTVFVVMLAAFQLWLHRNSGRDDIIVGTPFAERSRAEVQPLIGCFLNTLPIRTKFVKDESFRDLLRRVRGSALAAFDHADFPFAKMVELAVSQRGTAGASLFQTMFVLLEQSVPALQLGDAVSRTLPVETGTAKFDLTLFINAEGETWDCRLEYSTDLFSSADAAQMANEMVQLFGALAEDSSLALL
jgi:amino acid adenylation domain-containing protein